MEKRSLRAKGYRAGFEPPVLPEAQWCDFRKDYESGLTLLAISEKYYCDPRTVKACIMHNKPSTALGKHTVPVKLAPFYETIDTYLNERKMCSISVLTRRVYQAIKAEGYTGCERTVRNYIDSRLNKKKIIRKEDLQHDQNHTDRTQNRS